MRCIFEKGYSVEKHPEAVPCGTVVVLPTGSAETRGKQAALKLPSSPTATVTRQPFSREYPHVL